MKMILSCLLLLPVIVGPARGQAPSQATTGGQVLYGIASSVLVVIDLTTPTVVGATGFDPTGSLAISPSGLFFATHNDPRRPGPQLIQIDPLTGVGTVVSPVNYQLGGISAMAFDAAGTLFGVTFSDMLVTIDTNTGVVTTVGPTGIRPTAYIPDIAFDPSGVLFGVTVDGGDPTRGIPGAPQQLVRIDVTTGYVTTIDLLEPQFAIGGLACDASGRLFGTGEMSASGMFEPTLFEIDPTTATVTALGSIPFWCSHIDFTPHVISVSIDIKPGTYPNSIALWSEGVVPVALFGAFDFDVATVNPATVTLAGAPLVRSVITDFNGDGYSDLVMHFKTKELTLDVNSTEAILTGITYAGVQFKGTDSVRIVKRK